jgi:asparagine synthase (glutamine-hydrolysing)
MCGIVGFLQRRLFSFDPEPILRKMTASLVHRGPDGEGFWIEKEAGIALGHRRLSILDLSSAGHQPMISSSDRFVIVFNGEIYNFADIRNKLTEEVLAKSQNSLAWRGHSDTEVFLAIIENWGIERAVKECIGMFAAAIWDRQARELHLVRDRIGEKPLYYGFLADSFVFSSELKALRHYPSWQGNISRDAIALFLRHSYVPAPYSIFDGIHKLPPGTILTIRKNNLHGEPPVARPYWSLGDVVNSGIGNPFRGTDEEACGELDKLLRNAVAQQMVADVPLGAFLSGGIDSSTIVSLMQAQSTRRIRTFTIGFDERDYNEALYARAVADHLGTDHTELYITSKDAIEIIPKLPTLYDEPFSDSSQIPTYLIAALTRNYVAVSLSGDAGDELFGGYGRYLEAIRIWDHVEWIPATYRKVLANFLFRCPIGFLNIFFRPLAPFLARFGRPGHPGEKIRKFAEVLAADEPEELYRRLVSHWKQPTSVVLGSQEQKTVFDDLRLSEQLSDFAHRMMYLDILSYLPDDILVKVDRAAMGVSLETRMPFLDHRIVEFAWRLPLSMKIRNGQGKWILRQVLYKYVPRKLTERPKTGFGVPIDSWLRAELRDWAESLLNESRLRNEGYFDPNPIRKRWVEHLSGHCSWHYYLWDILMFQAWLERNK